ncbi:MAG: GNAT family N-acetyltransferase [Clostridia bacterium]|nr:GNAT family N-acetyltransferase [Clostridia bacterium]
MLNHKGTVNLETPRLILRSFIESDAEAMFKNWASRDIVTKYMSWFPHKDIEETKNIIRAWIEEDEKSNRYHWAIVLKSTNEVIGSIGVVRQKEDVKSAEMGYCIGDDFWHRGYTSEALARIIEYLFKEIGYNRISALHDVNNPNSGAVMKKCGMKYDGTLRESGLTKEGNPMNVSIYAILKSDWKEQNK